MHIDNIHNTQYTLHTHMHAHTYPEYAHTIFHSVTLSYITIYFILSTMNQEECPRIMA